jgi:hypothetical protein
MGKIYLWMSIKKLWNKKRKEAVVKTKDLKSLGFLINGMILIEKLKNMLTVLKRKQRCLLNRKIILKAEIKVIRYTKSDRFHRNIVFSNVEI